MRDHPRAGRGRGDGRPDRDPRRGPGRARGHARRAVAARHRQRGPATHLRSHPRARHRGTRRGGRPRHRRGRDGAGALPGRGRARRRSGGRGVRRHLVGRDGCDARRPHRRAGPSRTSTSTRSGRRRSGGPPTAGNAAPAPAPAPEIVAPSRATGAVHDASGVLRGPGHDGGGHRAAAGRADERRGLHDAAPWRDLAAHHRDPGRVPPLLLAGLGRLDTHRGTGRLLRARDPGPGRHVDGHGLARYRHGFRTRLRRAQAPGRHPARAAPFAGGEDHHHRRGRVAPGRRAAAGRAGAGLEPGRQRVGVRRGRGRPPSCSARPPSPASASSWRGPCGPK